MGEILPNYTILITYKKTQNNIQNTKKMGAEILYIVMNVQQRVHKKMKNLEWSFWQMLIGQEVLDKLQRFFGNKSWNLMACPSQRDKCQSLIAYCPSSNL